LCDKARIQSLVDLSELAQRLAGKPPERVEPSFRLEDCHGAKLVIVDKPASIASGVVASLGPANTTQQNGYRITLGAAKMPLLRLPPLPPSAEVLPPIPAKSRKPDGLPSVAKMILAALEEAAADGHDGLRPCDMAEFVRTTWWRDVQTKVVNTTAWQMARDGKLVKDGALYKLNGAGHV
jgi:hypothetical protein